jgi:hypothetical protein
MTAHQFNVEPLSSLGPSNRVHRSKPPQGPSQLDSTATRHRPLDLILLPKGAILDHTPLAWTFPGPPPHGDLLHPIFQPHAPHIQDEAADVESELTLAGHCGFGAGLILVVPKSWGLHLPLGTLTPSSGSLRLAIHGRV